MNNRKLKFIDKYIYSENFQELKIMLKQAFLDKSIAILTKNKKERLELIKLYDLLKIHHTLLDPNLHSKEIKDLYIIRTAIGIESDSLYTGVKPTKYDIVAFSLMKKNSLRFLTKK